MRASEFLFPGDLEVRAAYLRRVLFIGSCLSERYAHFFSNLAPEVTFEHILFNNVATLPQKSPEELAHFDLIYVQLPIRSIMTDLVVSSGNLNDRDFMMTLEKSAKLRLEAMLEASMKYSLDSGTLTLVSNFLIPQVRVSPSINDRFTSVDITSIIESLNRHLADILRKYEMALIADIEGVASCLGKRYFVDDSIVFYTHGAVFYPDWSQHEATPPWTAPERGRVDDVPPLEELYESRYLEFYEAAYRQLEWLYRVAHRVDSVKMVIFDLDNTLWRGQIAEHYSGASARPYTDGWPLGMWEAVQQLRCRGIIVSIVSKNDPDLVERLWPAVVDPPFVRLEDFFSPQISWRPKTDGIGKLMELANVLPNSVVFVDDHPVERSAVNAAFPDIRVIGSNPFTTRRVLLWSAETQVVELTSEARRRQEMLAGQVQRELERGSTNRAEFLKSLGCEITILSVHDNNSAFARSLELINRTNQFNTTGEKLTGSTLRGYIDGGGKVVAFVASDKFANYGLVGVARVLRSEIHQLVMSCRVLGNDIEIAFINYLVGLIRLDDACCSVSSRIIETAANSPCRDVYLRAGFERSGSLFSLSQFSDPVEAAHVLVR